MTRRGSTHAPRSGWVISLLVEQLERYSKVMVRESRVGDPESGDDEVT